MDRFHAAIRRATRAAIRRAGTAAPQGNPRRQSGSAHRLRRHAPMRTRVRVAPRAPAAALRRPAGRTVAARENPLRANARRGRTCVRSYPFCRFCHREQSAAPLRPAPPHRADRHGCQQSQQGNARHAARQCRCTAAAFRRCCRCRNGRTVRHGDGRRCPGFGCGFGVAGLVAVSGSVAVSVTTVSLSVTVVSCSVAGSVSVSVSFGRRDSL